MAGRARRVLVVSLALALVALVARVEAKGVVTGGTVQVVRAEPRGVEAGLPRTGAYGRGVALDAAGDHASALREYARALGDLDRLSDVLETPASCRAAWRGKVAWQRERSEELLEQEAYASVTPTSALAHA